MNGTRFALLDPTDLMPSIDLPTPTFHQRRSNGCPHMSLQPHEGSAEQGTCPSNLQLHPVDDPENLNLDRRILRHFSHRCRNSLSGIKLGLYLMKKEADGPCRPAGTS